LTGAEIEEIREAMDSEQEEIRGGLKNEDELG